MGISYLVIVISPACDEEALFTGVRNKLYTVYLFIVYMYCVILHCCRLHGLDDIPLERCRLAKYDEHYDACEFSYDDRDNEQFGVVLGGTRQSYFFELLLETREEDEEFERYAPNSTTLKVSTDLI